jgi:hypothetical protein
MDIYTKCAMNPKPCRCGSGQMRRPLVDYYGCFLDYVCDKCEETVLKKFKPGICDEPYEHDEPIDEDY